MTLVVTPILKRDYVTPPHVGDLVGIYTGSGVDSYVALNQATAIASLKTAIHTIIDSGDDPTTKKANCDSAIDSAITASVTVNKSAVLTTILSELKAALAAHEVDGEVYFGFIDKRCKGEGRVPANTVEGSNPDDDIPVKCPSCAGIGLTHTENTASSSWSATPELPA